MQKLTIEQCLKLDIFWLKQNNYLSTPKVGVIRWKNYGELVGNIRFFFDQSAINNDNPGHVELHYSLAHQKSGVEKQLRDQIALISTPCNYGGNRYWFICPFPDCQLKVGKLFLPPGQTKFGCRHCYQLTYLSCRKSHGKKRSSKLQETDLNMLRKIMP